mmetsp:Transcript_25741/g.35399  ORF Transcript_25741/g.35399 Transcript_25741/m.35399 type:complete len:332 (-) Transcript_25741:1237-2232(-)|eukprot:CAMPEP_0170077256 /NCGR_PEP_ID=MMETSP0019_2-20121128/14111_1 /TAXON_ID=98059 /ORGANISM="Dinobryon sp., Strain UTEXLB2267" /LENGTH=331 /DNA_ID=CAMNT_0010289479 /DNA_START=72 /DNA_END=1067 /DNA_ORIENTATION=-
MADFLENNVLTMEPNDDGAREFLSSQNWPNGLQNIFVRTLRIIPMRFFIFDDSGSMNTADGHKFVKGEHDQQTLVTCTRWLELLETVKFLIEASRFSSAPSEMRTLNGRPPFMVGTEDDDNSKITSFFETSPGGRTPLCKHIKDVITKIEKIAPTLISNGQKACVMIATDGEATDGDVMAAMLPLQDLPVYVVVRLCTDDEKVVKYWNEIDKNLELQLDILDDLTGEAKEVNHCNPWMTYGEPMQRLREFGSSTTELDMLDERPAGLDEIRVICEYIYGDSRDIIPHPALNQKEFQEYINQKSARKDGKVWNVLENTMKPWVDPHKIIVEL